MPQIPTPVLQASDINPAKSRTATRKSTDVVPKNVIQKSQVIQAEDTKPKDALLEVDSNYKKRNFEAAMETQSDEDEGGNTSTVKKRRKKKRGKGGGKSMVLAVQ
ncbi:hypothetical protein HDU79_001135 [Rhizoclosmatium sp. JEL0117]|nr:hypothetical protein HDU79_001135 [Rhizoclosmatium sp. JEL0117]